MSNHSLKEHLGNTTIQTIKPINHERVDESLILGAIVCSACIAYAAGPLLNNEFFKSVGGGIGNMLSGIGSLFSGFGKKAENSKDSDKSKPEDKESKELHDLLKKKPDDMTPKEKTRLKELANKYDVEDELSANELKKFNEITGKS